MHLFERDTGLNVMLDEVSAPSERWSAAPRAQLGNFGERRLSQSCDVVITSMTSCFSPARSRVLNSSA